MKYLKHYNQTYSNLCAVLGDLMLKKSKLDAEIETITNKINSLEAAQPVLAQVEQSMTKESQNEQEATNTPKIG